MKDEKNGSSMTSFTRLEKSLRQWGASPEDALRRLLGDHEFYKKLLGDFLNSHEFRELDEAVREGDTSKAFMAAHSLKGASATLGLIPLTDSLSRIVEDLRGRDESWLLVSDSENAQEMQKFALDLDNCHVEKSMLRRILDRADGEQKEGTGQTEHGSE